MDKFERKVFDTIEKYGLISRKDRIIIGFSGGVDSASLVYFLNKFKNILDIDIIAVHINHLIRDTSYRDEEFCVEFCKSLGVEILSFREDVRKISKERNMSLEEAGRFVRYSIFMKVLENRKFDKIATAHHLDDNVETFVHRLAKGSSITGLVCIKPKNALIIRPFILCSKEEIIEYASRNNIKFVVDETNFDNEYERNRIRNIIIPSITSYFPSFKKKVVEIVKDFWELEKFLEVFLKDVFYNVVERRDDGILIDLGKLSRYEDFVKKEIVKRVLKDFGLRVNRKIINILLKDESFEGNKRIIKFKNFEVVREYQKLRIRKLENSNDVVVNYSIGGVRIYSCCKIVVDIFEANVDRQIIQKVKDDSRRGIMWFSVSEPKEIIVRRRKKGDSINLGFGSKKIKELLIDEKVPLTDREKVVIVEIDGEVAGVFYLNKTRLNHKFLLKEGINKVVRIKIEE